MRAMVFAAGLGTRLRPLTEHVPKPLVPMGLQPLLAYTLGHLAEVGVRHVVVNAHHLADQVVAVAPKLGPASLKVDVVVEPQILGTGGGLRNAWVRHFSGEEPVFVVNGDVLFRADLRRLWEAHLASGAVATMVLREDPDAFAYGAVEINGANRVRRLLGEPRDVPGGEVLRGLMFTGVHVLSPRALGALPEDGCIIRHSYRRWVDGGEIVGAVVESAPWYDVGTLPAYLDANLALASGTLVWPGVQPGPRGLCDPSAEVATDARIQRSVIGTGARVLPGSALEDCVVWPGAVVSGTARRVVYGPGGVSLSVPGGPPG